MVAPGRSVEDCADSVALTGSTAAVSPTIDVEEDNELARVAGGGEGGGVGRATLDRVDAVELESRAVPSTSGSGSEVA
jgi:hypothetical protein